MYINNLYGAFFEYFLVIFNRIKLIENSKFEN